MPVDRDDIQRVLEAKDRVQPKPRRGKRVPRTQGGRKSAQRTSYGKGLAPSRKWWAATVVGAGTVGTAWAEAGEWSQTLTIAAIGFAVQRAVAWLVPNGDEA